MLLVFMHSLSQIPVLCLFFFFFIVNGRSVRDTSL